MHDYKLKIIKTEDLVNSHNYTACTAIIKCCKLQTEVVVDQETAVKRGRGLIDPINSFIIVTPEDIVLLSWDQLAKWISEKGLIPLR